MPGLMRPRNVANRNKEILGAYLKEKRLALGLTQDDLIKRLGIDMWHTAWSQFERGERNLPPHLWKDVSDVLGVSHREFAQMMLRYQHPWAFGMIWGFTPTLNAELSTIPDHYSTPQPEKRKARRKQPA